MKKLLLPTIFLLLLSLAGWCDPPGPEESAFLGAEAKNIECQLIGDGSSTSRTQIQFRNLSDEPQTFKLKEYAIFQAEGRQTLMVLQPKELTLPPRQAAKSTVKTMCVGTRTDPPATAEATTYQPSMDPKLAGQCQDILEKAQKAKDDGYFPALPIPPALQVQTIVQLAFWQQTGQLTKENLKPEILKQLKLEPEQMTPEEEKEVDQGLDNIWEAVDLCKK
jgi:hypothetical protein